jgi:hypothetical protein
MSPARQYSFRRIFLQNVASSVWHVYRKYRRMHLKCLC